MLCYFRGTIIPTGANFFPTVKIDSMLFFFFSIGIYSIYLMSLINLPFICIPPFFKVKFEISKKDILTSPSLLRENFPQFYCLIKKNFLGSSPPDSLYIGGLSPGKIANLGGIFGFSYQKNID